MKVAKDMSLVVSMERGDDFQWENKPARAYAHCIPISVAVFDSWHWLCAKVFAEIMAGGLGIGAGPRVAAAILKRQAQIAGVWEGNDAAAGAEKGLLGEMLRLTNVVIQNDDGQWITLPWEQAKIGNYLYEEDVSEVENALVFFSVNWRMWKRSMRAKMMLGAASLWGGRLSSLNVTEFSNSLTTSTKTELTDKATPSTPGLLLQPT